MQSFTVKKFLILGITLSTVEFSSNARTFSRSLLISQSQQFDKEREDSVVAMIQKANIEDEEVAMTPTASSQSSISEQYEQNGPRHLIVFGKVSSVQEVSSY